MSPRGSILFVDAYDSFAKNIAALLHEQLKVQVTLISVDCDIHAQFNQSNQAFISSFDAVVLGPGPGNPQNESDVGLFKEVWDVAAKGNIPVLGICLGFQSLCVQNGIPVVRMGLPCHGHAKQIHHAKRDIFCQAGALIATCYNSLGVRLQDLKGDGMLSRSSSSGSSKSRMSSESAHSKSSVSSRPFFDQPCLERINDLEVLAWDKDGWVMAARHKHLPFHAFQFHPESCKSNRACQTLIKQCWEAAAAHNRTHRNHVSARSADPGKPELLTLCDGAQKLLERLQYFARTCKGTVTRKSLHVPGGSGVIASLCHQQSSGNRVAMLESTKRGRYSIYAFPHRYNLLLEYINGQALIYVLSTNVIQRSFMEREQVLAALEAFIRSKSLKDNESDISFRGGFIGFMSYEFGMASLPLDVPKQDGSLPSTPDMSLLWVDRSIVFDHETGMAYVQSLQDGDPWVESMTATLQNAYQASEYIPASEVDRTENILSFPKYTLPNHDRYISKIRACQSELLAGNSYELCLTTEATITTPASPEAPYLLYRNIQQHNPVPFASYICLNKTKILSSSPEQFLSWSSERGTIDMIPMKGTVKKTADMTLEKATAILSSAKESAENLMIADLIRHDLYSTVGHEAKVEVVKLCDVIETETVFTLVSHVRAHAPIPTGIDRSSKEYTEELATYGFRALTRTLPPGSMTGAPKKRSCEILHNLEQRDRGVYSGAIGYIDVCGNGAWSVCIRSAFSNDDDNVKDERTGEEMQKWRIGAGGAITVLSDEEQEWEEMMTKLNSVLRGFRLD